MNRVCMDCRVPLGSVPCIASQDGKTSHGLCEPCYAVRELPELTTRIAQADFHDLTLVQLLDAPNIDDDTARLGVRMLIERRRIALRYQAGMPADEAIGRTVPL